MFKVIRLNIEIAITPPRIAQLRSNLVQSFITSQAILPFANVNSQGSKVNWMKVRLDRLPKKVKETESTDRA